MLSDVIKFFTSTSFNDVATVLEQHQFLIAIFTPISVSDFTIYSFGVLYGSGNASIFIFLIIVMSFIVFDSLVFLIIGFLKKKYGLKEKVETLPVVSQIDKIFKKYEKKYREHPGFLFFAIKVLPLTKFTIFFFALETKMSFYSFMAKDIVAIILWVPLLFIPGLFVGKQILLEGEGETILNFLVYFLIFFILTILLGEYIEKVSRYIFERIVKLTKRL